MFSKKIILSILFLFSVSYLYSQKTIRYDLPYNGKVSLNIYDEDGKLIRELLHAADRTIGPNRETWDMKDEDGNTRSSYKKYTWKVLLTKGISAKYIMSIGPTFPDGNKYWETGLGNHVGVTSVAADDKNLFVAAGISEGVRSHIKMDRDGKRCIASGVQPGAWLGFYARTIIGDYVYGLTQEAMILAHHKDSLNGMYMGVGRSGKSSCVGYNTGFGWSARHDSQKELPVFQCKQQATGNYNIWEDNNVTMDIANVGWNGKKYIIISYANDDVVEIREPLSGLVVKTFRVKTPKGVAGDTSGNIYLTSQSNIIKINCNDGKQQIIYSSLDDPYRIDIDIKKKELLVVDASSNQIKKISLAGKLIKTYGRVSGRRLGIYNAKDFFSLSDICVDGSGGFFATEMFPVTRLVHIKANGSLIKEWYGGTSWCTLASADENDPSVVWLQFQKNILLRCRVDYAKHSWKIHSVYNTDSIANGTYSLDTLKACGVCGVIGAGDCNWTVRKRNKETYLVFKNAVAVLKLDTVNWELKGCVSNKLVQDKERNTKITIQSWTDMNGDGVVQDDERKVYQTEKYTWAFRSVKAPVGFDYYWFSQTANAVMKLPVERWTSSGVPVYKEWGSEQQFNKDPLPIAAIALSQSDYFSVDAADSSLLVVINYGEKSWANVSSTKMFRINKDGRIVWQVGKAEERDKNALKWANQPKPRPGTLHAVKANVGVANGVVIATDYEGGWNDTRYGQDSIINKTAITYAWDKDGLYVGDVFDNWDASAKKWKYQLSSENGAGSLYTDPKTGDVYYYAGAENEVRIYLLTGWKDFQRISGELK